MNRLATYTKQKSKVLSIFWNRLLKRHPNHKFLFILSPPFCGSTLLHELISTSISVSPNNIVANREGQNVPSVKAFIPDTKERWNISASYNWKMIKQEWLKCWDLSFPILLEKSPPNIVRAEQIEKIFEPAYFIVLYRNPYAHCEKLIRKNPFNISEKENAQFAIKCLKHQRNNIENLEKVIPLSYEELTDDTEKSLQRMMDFIPEMTDMNPHRTFSAKNILGKKKMAIKNLNDLKISMLTVNQIDAINEVFIAEKTILDYFNYDIIHANGKKNR